MDLYGPPKVGGDILAYCGKCKMELAHVIMAMMSGRPVKVQCKTCKSPHQYRLSGGAQASRPTSGLRTPRAPSTRTTVRNSEYWEQKMAATKSPSRPYRPIDKFEKGQVIQHPKFGMGLVEEVKINGKIVVLFREEEKTLVHGLTKP